MAGARNILVVGPAWVGDMVMSQALYAYLQQTRPGVTIDVLAPAWSEPLLQRMPEVRSAIPLPVGHGELGLGRRWRLGLRGGAAQGREGSSAQHCDPGHVRVPPRGRIRPVALNAMACQDRLDVAIEIEGLGSPRGRKHRRLQCEEAQQKTDRGTHEHLRF